MRPLTDEETEAVFKKLSKYIGDSIRSLIERDDADYCFRLHKDRVYYARESLVRHASCIDREHLVLGVTLVSFGTCLGKFTKSGQFRLHVTALDYLAPYANHKIWLKPTGEQSFLYGNHVLKSSVGRMSDAMPVNAGVVVLSMSDMPLGFGVSAKSTTDARRAEPTAIVVLHQTDVGEYLRNEDGLL